MTLPEIPDEALERAALSAFGTLTGYRFVQAAVTAAWPSLYAAALRHAAEEAPTITDILERHALTTSVGPYHVSQAWRAELRRMADEATP